MKRIFPIIPALFILLLAADPIAGYAKQDDDIKDPPKQPIPAQPVAGDDKTDKHPVRDTSLGCATGAVLGSVLPGLGNAVGCVIGGFVGWWMS